MRVTRRGEIHNLPTIRQAIGGATDKLEAKVNCISAKAFKRAIRKKKIKEDTVFLGLIQKVQEPAEQVDVAKQYKRKSDLGAIHVWRGDMLECIQAILKEYNDIFPQDLPPGLPPVRMGHEFKIDLEDDTPPVHRPLYKLSPLELEETHKQIQYMLEHGFIRPSDSLYGAPELFAPKKDNGLQFCIDYCWLNKRIIRSRYPLPLLGEMLDHLGGAKVFNRIDLKSGYCKMPIREQDIPKTAFRMRWGLYKILVMPFSVTNAPSQFMHMINDVLAGYLDVFVLVFLDDILVYSCTMEEHAEHLQKVFVALRKHHLFTKASKCSIMVKEVEFLGQWVTPQGASLLKEKLKAVCNWKRPQTMKNVRSFLGFANYYPQIIKPGDEITER